MQRDLDVVIFDIETFKELFDIGIYTTSGEWFEFEISHRKNDLYKIVKFYKDSSYDYWVSFNGVNFDHQVMQFIVENHEDWIDFDWKEICKRISDFASELIENQNYEIKPPFKESNFEVRCIDLFKIHHFDNKQRRTSLKAVESMLNIDVEEMPVDHTKEGLTSEEIDMVQRYRRHDVIATYCLYLLTRGKINEVRDFLQRTFNIECDLLELKDYQDKDKIQDRLDLISSGLLSECMNYSDSKIGDELNKVTYCQLTGKKISDLFNLKKKRGPTKKFTYGDAIPKYVTFKTKEFKDLYDSLKNITVSLLDKDNQEFPFSYNGTEYRIARGGIHSCEKNRYIKLSAGMILRDADVGLICGPIKTL